MNGRQSTSFVSVWGSTVEESSQKLGQIKMHNRGLAVCEAACYLRFCCGMLWLLLWPLQPDRAQKLKLPPEKVVTVVFCINFMLLSRHHQDAVYLFFTMADVRQIAFLLHH